MTDEQKPKKRQSKRDIVILEDLGVTEDNPAVRYELVGNGFESAAEANKWIRKEGERLNGKMIAVGNLSVFKKVTIETKTVTKF